MIPNEDPQLANSLWTATAGSAPDCPALRGSAETDVAIVGGGYTGLSAALHLAEAGVAVTLLEAETPGWGASGRNGGQVNPGLKPGPDAIMAWLGPDMGARVNRLAGTAPDLVFELIERHAIDCDAARPGWITTGVSAATGRSLTARASELARHDAPVRMLTAAETVETLGTEVYHYAMRDDRGGLVHPLNYALGLARAAQSAGAVLHGGSCVTAMTQEGSDIVLVTDSGQLRARRVLICTNAYTDGTASPLERTLVPVRSMQVATSPLPENLRRSILPGKHAVSDGRRLVLYFRMDAAGRFIMGGRGSYSASGTRRRLDALRRVAVQLYPQLRGIDWIHGWGGLVAMTTDHLPHLTRLAPSVMAATGFNGRGVAMATATGRILADWATGTPEEALDFPVRAPQPIPLHTLRKPAVGAMVAWYGICDRIGIR